MFSRMDVDRFFSVLNNLYNPSELLEKLGGIERLPLLTKDTEIYAALDKRLTALLDTKLTLSGPNAKFFEEQLLPHERLLKESIWWAIPYGYSVIQIIYNEDGSGNVEGFQSEDFWRFVPQPDLIHVKLIYTTNSEWNGKVLPYGKWVLTTHGGTSSNPSGKPILEKVIQPWIFRCTGWDLLMDFAKRFANGFLHAAIEDKSKQDEVRAALEKAGKSSILVTDKTSEFSLLQANRDSGIYALIDDRTKQSIQKVILGETQTSDMQERGSSASAGVQNEVRLEKTRADISLVEKGLNEIIRQIADVNELSEWPEAKLIYDPGLNQELATRDSTLYGIGVRFTDKYFARHYGFEEDEFEVVEATPSPFMFKKDDKGAQLKSFLKPEDVSAYLGPDPKTASHKCISLNAEDSRKSKRQLREKEEIAEFLRRNAAPPIDMELLISTINLAENEKDLDERLTALFDYRSTEFIDTMTDTLYYAATKGALFGNPERLPSEEE